MNERHRVSFVEYGLQYFGCFINFPESLSSISLEDIEQRNKNVKRLGDVLTDTRLALVISKVHCR